MTVSRETRHKLTCHAYVCSEEARQIKHRLEKTKDTSKEVEAAKVAAEQAALACERLHEALLLIQPRH